MDISKKELFGGINTEHIKEQLQSLTLEQKIGQLFIAATVADPNFRKKECYSGGSEVLYLDVNDWGREYIENLIREYHIGGLIFQRRSTPKELYEAINHYQEFNSQYSIIPLWVSQDLEWGLTMRLDDTVRFPKNMTLGAIANNQLLYYLGKEVARQCKILGVHINNAPVVDVNTNPLNPIINDRSFGEDKEIVAQKALAIMKGLQDSGIIACAKHFPGHGDTATDSHFDLPVILHSLERINDVELYPFTKLIEEGVKAVMTAHIFVPVLNTQGPATLSKEVISQLLKKRLGFEGLIITDGLDMNGVCQGKEKGEPERLALLAGNDILLCPPSVPQAFVRIKEAINGGKISEAELDEHVSKILAAKAWAFAHQEEKTDIEYLHEQLHTEYAYKLKQELYCQAITLVRNDNILPLADRDKPISYVQIGSKEERFMKELNKYHSFVSYNLPSDASLENINSLLEKINCSDTVIIGMLGMNRSALQQYGITASVKSAVEELKKHNKNVIVVIFGSPYSLKWFEDVPAIIMAYEDDPDAQISAANVLVGNYNPRGTLPVTASPKFSIGTSLSY